MTSLTDVYEGSAGRVANRRQRLVGTGLFLAGATMLVGAIAVATTQIGNALFGTAAARELAGVLAGLGLPALLLGAFAVQPAGNRLRAAASIGTGIAVLGVTLFTAVYPQSWIGTAPLAALATLTVYVVGVGTTFWCLFLALATFDPRAAPGGTARMEVTEEGTIRLVEGARTIPGVGGVGLFGEQPDGHVATQTNQPDASGDDTTGTAHSSRTTGTPGDDGATVLDDDSTSTTTADGGSATIDSGSATVGGGSAPDPGEDDAEFLTAAQQRGRPDAYCGNCAHFEYVKVDGDIEPHCGYHDELMDDMDACPQWVEND